MSPLYRYREIQQANLSTFQRYKILLRDCQGHADRTRALTIPSFKCCPHVRTVVSAMLKLILGVETMRLLAQYRANAGSCRERAANEPTKAIHWLSEAQRWERLAEEEVSSHFIECNVTSSSDLANSKNL
jgi:hypothetical protein